MNKRQVGKEKELLAITYLKQEGYEILAHNYWIRGAEIDIIAKDEEYYVFLEVKYRKSKSFGGPAYSITQQKKRTIAKCAMHYIVKQAIPLDSPFRFDVVLICGEEIELIKNAFDFPVTPGFWM